MTYFDGEVAIVTGGAAGIGFAIAESLAKEGARVVITNRRVEKGEEAAQAIVDAGGDAIYIQSDVSDVEQVERLVAQTVDHYGGLDIAVNNAGIGGPTTPLLDYPQETWEQVIQINLLGYYYCLKHQLPPIIAGGGGAVVNMTSVLGTVGGAGLTAYTASKHAIVGLTKSAALEYATANVRINAVAPGYIDTPLLDPYRGSPEIWSALEAAHPVNRMGKSGEVAELVTWLCSDRASFCTGGVYFADGGFTAR